MLLKQGYRVSIFVSFVILLIVFNCQTKFQVSELVINAPIGLTAYPTNKGIIVKFYGNNVEEGFRGYNIYVSKYPGISSQNIKPVKNRDNGHPTLPYGSYGCFPDSSQQSFITIRTDSNQCPISNRKTYYVTATAYCVINGKEYESDHSNESKVIPLNEGDEIIYNHRIAGKTNDGIRFNYDGTVNVIDAPDTILTNWGGDFVFELKNINGIIKPCIVIKSNQTYIQDIGYYNNINEVDNIPNSGYISPDVVLPVYNSHIYILYKPEFNNFKYIRIYILSAPDNPATEFSDVSLKIKWAY